LSDPEKIGYGKEFFVRILNLDIKFFIFLLSEPDFDPNLPSSELSDPKKSDIGYQFLVRILTCHLLSSWFLISRKQLRFSFFFFFLGSFILFLEFHFIYKWHYFFAINKFYFSRVSFQLWIIAFSFFIFFFCKNNFYFFFVYKWGAKTLLMTTFRNFIDGLTNNTYATFIFIT